jgi:hypothetical protein
MTDGSRGIHLTDGIHPTDRRVKMEMRRIATLETGLGATYSPVADATAMMFRVTDPWDKSHGYHHASAPRGANGIAQRLTDGSRGIYSTDGICAESRHAGAECSFPA